MKYTLMLAGLVLTCTLMLGASSAQAQTYTTTGTSGQGSVAVGTGIMPVLYNSSGQSVNTSGGSLAPGYYYLTTDAHQQVYYYGDGTFYNSTTGLFGGNVSNPTGAAGSYTVYGSGSAGTVGIPNTGVGGDAGVVWAMLAFSLLASLAGGVYVVRAYRRTVTPSTTA